MNSVGSRPSLYSTTAPDEGRKRLPVAPFPLAPIEDSVHLHWLRQDVSVGRTEHEAEGLECTHGCRDISKGEWSACVGKERDHKDNNQGYGYCRCMYCSHITYTDHHICMESKLQAFICHIYIACDKRKNDCSVLQDTFCTQDLGCSSGSDIIVFSDQTL